MREHAVGCAICRRDTFNDSAVCDRESCTNLAAAALARRAATGPGPTSPRVLAPLSANHREVDAVPRDLASCQTAGHAGTSMTRRALVALAATHERVVAESSPPPAGPSGSGRPSHHATP